MIALACSLVAGLAAGGAIIGYLADCARLQPCQREREIIEKGRAIQRGIL
jgi:hypothetical protein